MSDDVQRQIEWLEIEADLYDQQGLTTDMEYGNKLYAIKSTIESQQARIELLEKQHEYSGTQACLDRIERLEAEVSRRDTFIGAMLRRESEIIDGYEYKVHFEGGDPRNELWELATSKSTVSDSHEAIDDCEPPASTDIGSNQTTLDDCYEAGKKSVTDGASEDNCHFRYFGSPESTAEWERGAREARQKENP